MEVVGLSVRTFSLWGGLAYVGIFLFTLLGVGDGEDGDIAMWDFRSSGGSVLSCGWKENCMFGKESGLFFGDDLFLQPRLVFFFSPGCGYIALRRGLVSDWVVLVIL